MKKVLIAILGIVLTANIVIAATSTAPIKVRLATTVGIVKSIDTEAHSFVIEKTGIIKYVYKLLGWLKLMKPTSAQLTVLTSDQTVFQKKTIQGVATSTFKDLAINQRVQVKGTTLKDAIPNKVALQATHVFILTPAQAALKQCESDTDCGWCGNTCVAKNTLKGKKCPDVMPPAGLSCKCQNNICQKTATSTSSSTVTTSTSTTTTISEKTCLKACQDKHYHSGICRSWPITATAHYGCNPKETDIGWSTDCNVPQGLLGVGKTCCCKNQD